MQSAQSSTTARLAWRTGVREALGAPVIVLGVGFVGYGSLAQSHGFSLFDTVLSTLSIWALPGQLILIEMEAAGASFLAIVLAVALSASRFLPMTVTLMPRMRTPGVPGWRYYVAGHLLAMMSWAVAVRRFPKLQPEERMPFFFGFTSTMWVAAMLCTASGYSLAGTLPGPLRLAFVFATPLYFILILTSDLRDRMTVLSLLFGALAAPALHLVWPSWGLVGGGLIGGTLGYLIGRRFSV